MAFNCFAALRGYDESRWSRFDQIKRYIRCPYPREFWRYIAGCVSSTDHCKATLIEKKEKHYIRLHIYCLDFIVCLENPDQTIDPHHPDLCIIERVGQWRGKTPIGLIKA